MKYIYIKTEARLWTVGFYNPENKFVPESDHSDPEKAAARVHYLNGGSHEYPGCWKAGGES